ncbi:MAG: hypothetical protein CVV64_14205 [Candidatus Wallbacteria bacterium HGW-Wallbacteria-1]|uniref:Uncharacterized protein n=1 Tax=Candidatus Wallbacteria bacterium HGW-Wallbacteria-1 TaxID=2013854 RepID=A0A2N1PM82_9BACT|nr:MAG: hypothetical protein CVV64_14205 [Candidatus Wallbacteria bacterium HGW-Wallbacteria-1]
MIRTGVLDSSERIGLSKPVMINIDPGKDGTVNFTPLRGAFPTTSKIFMAHRDPSGRQIRKVVPISYSGRTVSLKPSSPPRPSPSDPPSKDKLTPEKEAEQQRKAFLTIKNTTGHNLSFTALLAAKGNIAVIQDGANKGVLKATNQLPLIPTRNGSPITGDLDLGVLRLSITCSLPAKRVPGLRTRPRVIKKNIAFKVKPNARVFTITPKMLGLD